MSTNYERRILEELERELSGIRPTRRARLHAAVTRHYRVVLAGVAALAFVALVAVAAPSAVAAPLAGLAGLVVGVAATRHVQRESRLRAYRER